MSLTNDYRKIYNTMFEALFPNHPYGTQTVLGTQEHLKNPSITNVKEYHKQWYVPNNMSIALAGDFDPDEAIDIITRYFGHLKPNYNLPVLKFKDEEPITSPKDFPVSLRYSVLSKTKGFRQGALPGEDFVEAGRDMEGMPQIVKSDVPLAGDWHHVPSRCGHPHPSQIIEGSGYRTHQISRFEAYFCNFGIAKRRRCENPVRYAGPLLLRLYAGHLHPHYRQDAAGGSGEGRQLHGDDFLESIRKDFLY